MNSSEQFFLRWSEAKAPRGGSNDKKKRLIWLTWKEGYDDFVAESKKENIPTNFPTSTSSLNSGATTISDSFSSSINVNYFAPYHGHNLCDSHFGVGKRMLRQTVGTGVVANEKQIMDCFSSIDNTFNGIELEIDEKLTLVTAFPEQLRKWFSFKLEKKGEIWSRISRNDEFILQKVVHTEKVAKEKLPTDKAAREGLKKYLNENKIEFAKNAPTKKLLQTTILIRI